MMKVVAAVDPRETPVESGLVFVMPGAVLGEYAFAIGSDDGMKIWTMVRSRVLSQYRRIAAGTMDGDRARFALELRHEFRGECWLRVNAESREK